MVSRSTQATTDPRASRALRARRLHTLGLVVVGLALVLCTASSASAQDTDLDLGIVDGRSIVFPGASITYLVELTNFGPGDASSAIVTITLPPELESPVIDTQGGTYDEMSGLWNGFCLSAGGVVSLRVSGTVASSVGQTLELTASVAPDGTTDPDGSNNVATDVNRRPDVFADGFESGDSSAWSFST